MQRHPRTDHQSGLHALANTQREQRGNGDAEQKEDGMLRNFCTSDGVGFHRIQTGLVLVGSLWKLLFAVGYVADYDVQKSCSFC